MSEPAQSRPTTRSLVVDNLWTLLASGVGTCYALFVARPSGTDVAMVWPASAVAFTAIALRGWRLFPAVALGAFGAALLDQRPLAEALFLVVPAVVELAIAVALIKRTGLDLRFRRAGDAARLAVVAGLGSVGGAMAGVAIMSAVEQTGRDTMGHVFLSWTLGHAIGMLAFAPALLLWLGEATPIARPRRPELAALVVSTVLVCAFVLLTYEVGTPNRVVAMWLTLVPLLLWTSVRADIKVAAAVVVVLSIAGTTGVRLGTGALATSPGGLAVLNVQAFHVMMVLMVLVGASTMSAYDRALAQSRSVERTFSLVFDGTRDSQTLYSVPDTGMPRVVMANRSWLDAMKVWRPDLSTADAIGKSVDEMRDLLGLTPAEAAVHQAHMDQAIATGKVIMYEAAAETPAGPRLIEATLVPMREGERTRYVLATARDITRARLSEQQLRESEVRFAAVSDATQELQMLFAVGSDQSMRLVHLNRAAREMHQRFWPLTADRDFVGLPAATIIRNLPGFTDEQFDRNLHHAREAIATRTVRRFEDQIATPHGGRTAEVTIIPILNDAGEVTHLLRSSADISDRKTAEESVRRFNEDLERRVAERTEQLAMANRELEAFGYSLSHDLRAPLRSVEGFSRALLEDAGHGDTRQLEDYARRINAAALRMKALVDDLLRLSQLSTADTERAPIDLSAMAGDILRELAANNPERAMTTTVEPGMRATADARLVSIALQNLLDNAWKYTARQSDPCVQVGQMDHEGVVATFVRDNGVGFDPRYAGRLFAPFERLHKHEEFEGAGIGLATVQRIIAAHGGRVWAHSAPGAGATFYFTLEHSPADTAAPA